MRVIFKLLFYSEMEIIIDIHDHEGNSEDRAVYVFDQEVCFLDI
jgi:hypothetical protein